MRMRGEKGRDERNELKKRKGFFDFKKRKKKVNYYFFYLYIFYLPHYSFHNWVNLSILVTQRKEIKRDWISNGEWRFKIIKAKGKKEEWIKI